MTRRPSLPNLVVLLLVAGLCPPALADRLPPPLADVHLHYNWDQQSVVNPLEANALLQRQNVVFGVVSATPPDLALELQDASQGRVIALYRPYLDARARHDWFRRPQVLKDAREALASKRYKGIGELHLVAGLGPRRDNKVLTGLLALAKEFDVPALIHTEASSYKYFLPVCRQHRQVRILWAHAGGLLDAAAVAALLPQCPNVHVELSARDPWRYVNSPITDTQGRLLPGWKALLLKYPDRFMIGSDPVWPVEERHLWSEVDTGWEKLPDYLAFHRTWLADMPAAVKKKVELENALVFFRVRRAAGMQMVP